MTKQLKLWNGAVGVGKYAHVYVAAYSAKQASELVSDAVKNRVTPNTIHDYYSCCWGYSMSDITPTEPCVYGKIKVNDKPIRLL